MVPIGRGVAARLPALMISSNAQMQQWRSVGTMLVGGARYSIPRTDSTVLSVLRHHGFPIEFDCREGRCQKCTVEVLIDERERISALACQEPASDGLSVILPSFLSKPDAMAAGIPCWCVQISAQERAEEQKGARKRRRTHARNP